MFVRYRYMTAIQTRYKTIELIIDEKPWIPQNTPIEFLSLYIEEDEDDVRECIQMHGGRWDAGRKLWLLPTYKVHMLGMEHRVIPDFPAPELALTTSGGKEGME